MCATIAAMAVQITRTQIATAMAAEISDIVSSFTFMVLLSIRLVAVFRARVVTSESGVLEGDRDLQRGSPSRGTVDMDSAAKRFNAVLQPHEPRAL
jgi:hypothetical protein